MYIALALIGLFILFVVLTDLGPQHSSNKFWATCIRIRIAMDHFFAVLFTCMVALACAAAIIFGVYNWINGGGTSSIVTGAVFIIILGICYLCIKNLKKSAEREEACECCGDCSKCKIQCRTNEKYYGLKAKNNN